ncbi:hypothetical protein, partial [Glaciihabitans sp. UYNi722]|uniref:hypothetical protein n=1 Tax=Glaciihabitans sp. UYNi722 TaxID=3156344 RepID=UPI00339A2D9C
LPGSIFFGRITDGASPQDGVITALLVTVTTYLLTAVAGLALPKPRPSLAPDNGMRSLATLSQP